jgi:arylsulfatase A-like enzyme/Flp pilus assembly protein TadD
MNRADRKRSWGARALWPALALVLLTAAAVAYNRRPPATDAAARARLAALRPAPAEVNVVVVTLDTTRADRLGCYGFAGGATPHLDRLAREGVLFERATATVPLTLPSHASIFTGTLPPRHGVHDNGGFILDAGAVTLAERFQAAGYATGAFVAAWVLDSKWGLGQGFDRYSDKFDLSKYKVVSLGTVQKRGDEVMDDALRWMETVKQRKFLAWVHLYDPHTPYDPPEPYRSRHPSRYLGEIAWTDAIVGRLTDWLEREDLMRRTVVIVTADHGESLGEHGEGTHGFFIYDATTRVPLLVRTPWALRGRVRAQVSTVDVFPTALDLAGLAPQEGIDGRSLVRALLVPGADLGHVAYSETYYPRFHYGWQHLQGLRDGRYQFIEAPEPELYDVLEDPGERTNVLPRHSRAAEGLRARLRELAGAGGVSAPDARELDPDTLERLAALGYVGGAADVGADEVLPDPKHKIGLYGLMQKARDLGQREKYEEAVAAMSEVLAQDPKIVDAHLALGNWLLRLRRDRDAEAAYKQALVLKPEYELAITSLAQLYRGRGEQQKAAEAYKAALLLDARAPQTWYQLATLYLDLGQVAEAEKTFRQALAANPKMGAALNSLGAIAWAGGERGEAERLIRQALELEPDVRTGRFNLARVLEARGDLAGAERLYREELSTYPDNGKARFNLAQLLRERGDFQGYVRELAASIEKAPDFGPPYFFLAREELKNGGVDGAFEIAERGLQKDPGSELAPLGHYVLADVWSRRGDRARAEAEAAKGRKLEARLRSRPRPIV